MATPEPADDLSLLKRIASRHDAALAELYDRHHRLAFAVIRRIVQSRSDAEEVLHETFVRVWSRAETYDGRLDAAAARELPLAVGGAVAALPAAQRTLIEAAFFEGYTHQELSARFGVPLGTVKTRMRSGLVSLRVRLEQTA